MKDNIVLDFFGSLLKAVFQGIPKLLDYDNRVAPMQHGTIDYPQDIH
jgi:hypothetical protein